jgi:hypothetical protein
MGRAGVLNVGDVRRTENPGRGMHHLARQVVFPSRKKVYSDMVLLGSWFAPEHEYDVNI